jgi:4-amino-4-deoxy-L-arabinose transferase-like glycosyltransferase
MRKLGWIGFILLLALVVRLVGIDWALPEVYHVDESTLVRAAYGMRFGSLNPGFFDWPSLYKYLLYFLFAAFIKLRVPFQVYFGVETMRRLLPFWWGAVAPFYLLARLLTMFFDLGSVMLVFVIGRKLFSHRVGLLAALLMALNAAAVHGVHYDRLEVPATFFMLLSLWFAAAVMESDRWRDYLWAGLFAGLAASTKYNGALVVVSIVTASALSLPIYSPFGHAFGKLRKLLAAGLMSVVGFLLGTPYALLDFKTFWSRIPEKGFLWQFEHLGRDLNWWNYIYGPMRQDWGVLFLLLFLSAVLWALWRRRRNDLLLLSFPFLYFFLTGRLGLVRGHYLLPLYPFLLILLARFIDEVILSRWSQRVVFASTLVLTAALFHPVSLIVNEDISGLRGDTRNLARDWITENIPRRSRIAIDGTSWPSHLGGVLPTLPRIEDNPQGYKLFLFGKNVEIYAQNWDYLDYLFQKEDIGYYITSDLTHGRLKDLSFYDYLRTKKTLLKKFVPYWYTGPTIEVYKLQ